MGLEVGQLHVRRCGLIAAAPARVWQEFTSRERLAAWFGHGHTLETFDPTLGSEVVLSVQIDGETRRFGGPLRVFEPERELSYESNWRGETAWPVPTFHTLRLSAADLDTAEGPLPGTLVEIFHHGFERLGRAAGAELESYEAGWSNHHIVRLRSIIEGPSDRSRAPRAGGAQPNSSGRRQ